MPKYEEAHDMATKISATLEVAYNEAERTRDKEKDDSEFDALTALNSPEKVIAFLQKNGIDTTSLKVTVDNADKPVENAERNGGINYANCKISIHENGKLLLEKEFSGPEVGGW